MKIGDSRDLGGVGILPLQHHNFKKQNIPYFNRASLVAYRITERKINPGEFGHWIYDVDTVGDVINTFFWNKAKQPTAKAKPRKTGAWSFLFPSIVQEPPDDETKVKKDEPEKSLPPIPVKNGIIITGIDFKQTGKPKPKPLLCCQLYKKQDSMLPVGNDKWEADEEFKILDYTYPKDKKGERLWNIFPIDYYGIALTTTETDKQTNMFMPTDPRLICVNNAGDARMSHIVTDTLNNWKIDQLRQARLHSVWRVVRPRGPGYYTDKNLCDEKIFPERLTLGCIRYTANVIAWQIGSSGCGSILNNGLMYDSNTSSIGAINFSVTGPIDAGGGGDIHVISETLDREPINSAHISTKALFKRGGDDAPLEFGGGYKQPPKLPYETRAYLRFDPESQHEHVCGIKPGLWRWLAECAFYRCECPPNRSTGIIETQGAGSGRIQTGTSGDGTKTGTGEPTPRPQGQTGVIKTGEGSSAQPGNRSTDGRIMTGVDGIIWRPSDWERINNVHEWDSASGINSFNATTIDTAFNAVLFRPQPQAFNFPDYRFNPKHVDASLMNYLDATTPVTMRLEAFGAQGGTDYNSNEVGSQNGWVYTQVPGSSRYCGGTSSGGILLLPPELDIANKASSFNPSTITQSNSYFIAVPNVYYGAGIPDTTYGRVQCGYSWTANRTSCDLEFYSHKTTFNNGNPSIAIKFTNDQNICFRSQTNFWGCFEHAITADRTWTFPDKDGTVAMLSDISGAGEANTASNVGAGGIGLFKQKTGVDLEFRNINSGTGTINVVLDNPNNEVDIDVVANTTNQRVEVMKAGSSIGTRKTINFIEGTNITLTIVDDAGNDRVNATITAAGSVGEANTASNVGVGGIGIFKQKTGIDLEFKNINAGSSKITITDDVVNNEVDIDLVEGNIAINNLSGTLGVTKGGTGTSTTFTQGSVIFAGASGIYSQANAEFYWDDTAKMLGINTNLPSPSNANGRGIHLLSASSLIIPETKIENTATSGVAELRVLGKDAGANVITGIFQSGNSISTDGTVIGTITNSPFYFATNNTLRGVINTSGYWGVGTTAPDGLQINIAVAETARTVSNVRAGVVGNAPRIILENATFSSQWEFDNFGGDLRIFQPGAVAVIVKNSTLHFGIAVDPVYRLEVSAAAGAGTFQTIQRLRNDVTAANNTGVMTLFTAKRSGGTVTDIAQAGGVITDITAGAYKGAYVILTANNAAPAERVRIDNEGRLGVGTASPDSKSHVHIAKTFSVATGDQQFGLINKIVYSIADVSFKQGLRNDVDGTHTTGTQSNLVGYRSFVTQFNAGNVTNMYGTLTSMQVGSTSTASNVYGHRINIDTFAAGATITNAYNIYIANASRTGTITNLWGVYQEDTTAKNYFAGNIGVGGLASDLYRVYISRVHSVVTGDAEYLMRSEADFSVADVGLKTNMWIMARATQTSASGTMNQICTALFMPVKTNTGAVTNSYAIYTTTQNNNATNAITNAYAVYIASNAKTGAITNEYGVYQLDSGFINYFNGKSGFGNNAPTSLIDVAGSTTSVASFRMRSGTAPTTPNDGDFWYDSTQKSLVTRIGNLNQNFGTMYTMENGYSLTNTIITFNIFGTGEGTRTLPANFLQPGKMLEIFISGVYSTDTSPQTITLQLEMMSTAIVSTGAVTLPANAVNRSWQIHTVVTAKSTTTVEVNGTGFVRMESSTGCGALQMCEMATKGTPVTVPTSSGSININATWGAASVNNVFTSLNGFIRVLN